MKVESKYELCSFIWYPRDHQHGHVYHPAGNDQENLGELDTVTSRFLSEFYVAMTLCL